MDQNKTLVIKDLKEILNSVNLEGVIAYIEQPRTTTTNKKVASAILRDATGEIKISLWEEKINQFKENQKVRIEGAYITSFNGEYLIALRTNTKITILD